MGAAGAGAPGAEPAPRGAGASTRVLFVCLGNICRSPTAEGVMRELVAHARLQDAIAVDSAGTGGWHAGEAPDRRAAATALSHEIVLDGRARQVTRADFEDFDLLIAMDRDNARDLRQLASGEAERAQVRLLREFDPASASSGDLDVPDPYHGGPSGFEHVFDLVSAACEGLLEQIRAGRPLA